MEPTASSSCGSAKEKTFALKNRLFPAAEDHLQLNVSQIDLNEQDRTSSLFSNGQFFFGDYLAMCNSLVWSFASPNLQTFASFNQTFAD